MSLGTDLVYLPRLEKLYQTYGDRFLNRIFTLEEQQFCLRPVSLKAKVARMGGRIAAKEAIAKTLGVGIAMLGNPKGAYWTQIEFYREERQAPKIRLYQKAADRATALGIDDWWVSVTHDGDYAMAVIMGLRNLPIPITLPPTTSL